MSASTCVQKTRVKWSPFGFALPPPAQRHQSESPEGPEGTSRGPRRPLLPSLHQVGGGRGRGKGRGYHQFQAGLGQISWLFLWLCGIEWRLAQHRCIHLEGGRGQEGGGGREGGITTGLISRFCPCIFN